MNRRTARSGSTYENRYGFSRAVRDGTRVVVSGTAPVPPPGEDLAPTAYEQARRCCEIILNALGDLGAASSDVVRTRMYITDASDADDVGRAHREAFGDVTPAATMVVVAALLDPDWKVEIEAEASISSRT